MESVSTSPCVAVPDLFNTIGAVSDDCEIRTDLSSPIGAPLAMSRLNWPALEQLRLGENEQRARSTGIGGSDANVILSGDRDKIISLWREKRNESEAPDLSDRLP